MSDAVSALSGVEFQGIARVEELGLVGMITIRGDFSSKAFAKAVSDATGCDLPKLRSHNAGNEGRVLAWMSPDELLLITAHDAADADVSAMQEKLGDEHALVVNVSDARAVFRISGEACREVVGKLAPVDMDSAEFAESDFRRTRFAQVPAAFWMRDAETIDVVCFRSVGQYMFDLLSVAAQDGSEVGVY